MPKTVAPYGAWRSPITADLIVAGTVRLGQIALDGDAVYWDEGRPTDGGRGVLVRATPDGRIEDVTPEPFNVRSRVHEYGGGAFAAAGGLVVFSHFADHRLYRLDPGGAPVPITPEGRGYRYADLRLDRRRDRVLCVREEHATGGHEPVNTLVAVDLAGDDAGGEILAEGHDFYASPRLDPAGDRLAWLAWDHPNMPWDGCELSVADIAADGSLSNAATVAGGREESIFQPDWSPAGLLHFVSDRTGWWNLYRLRDGAVEPLRPMEAEFGQPQWVFGQSTYGFVDEDRIACAYRRDGRDHLATLDPAGGDLSPLSTPFSEIAGVRAAPGVVVFRGASPTEPPAIARFDLATGETTVLRRASSIAIDSAYVAIARPIEFPTEGGQTAFAYHYPPTNPDFGAPPDERPPLIVQIHGGPTGATSTGLNPAVQYWTSRGFAVLDVDYGGSAGYGRAYRRRLDGRWGIVDVDDAVNGARFLVAEGVVDPDRLAIRGGSAGGYTTLAALAFRDLFGAGVSLFGIGDLEAMVRDTHKFEARYFDRLVAPYPARRDVYRQRSPIHAVDRITAPLLLLQGLDDKVVPPNQAETMVETLAAQGRPVAYVPFAGEGHGFRGAETIKRALEAELSFYGQVFGIPIADPVAPVAIANLPGSGR